MPKTTLGVTRHEGTGENSGTQPAGGSLLAEQTPPNNGPEGLCPQQPALPEVAVAPLAWPQRSPGSRGRAVRGGCPGPRALSCILGGQRPMAGQPADTPRWPLDSDHRLTLEPSSRQQPVVWAVPAHRLLSPPLCFGAGTIWRPQATCAF